MGAEEGKAPRGEDDSPFKVRDDWDESKHPRAKNGKFDKGNSLQSSKNNAKVNTKIKATAEEQSQIRKELVGIKTSCGAVITGVWTHACDMMVARRVSTSEVKETLKNANPTKDPKWPDTYNYAINGKFVAVYYNGEIKTVIVKGSKTIWRRIKK